AGGGGGRPAAEGPGVRRDRAARRPGGGRRGPGPPRGVPAMTAYWCLFADGQVSGKTVLVAGGAGAVGHYAIELAVRAGARVIATASGSEKAEFARTAGVAHVVNYRDADAADQIRAAAGQTDRIIELALGANLALDLAVAKPGSVIVDYAAEPADPVLPVRACMTANLTLRFVLLYGVPRAALRQAAEGIPAALADGARPELPVHRFGLSDIVAAHEAAEAGPLGKVLVAP